MSKDIIFYIRLVHFALEREKNIYFESQNLTSSQGDILLFLGGARWHNKEVNQKDIEQHFRLSNPTVTGLLNRLEEKGFVERKKSQVDGRNKNIYLTDHSLSILDQFKDHNHVIDQKLFYNIDKSEQKMMLEYLKKLLANLNNEPR
ncbi:MarR family transcriptional regulator [Amphibacillus sp. MSJ-3]|uniref:MarR family winged helix-turn-helix transcriptional regulator n=1 Tax=Amphibacillus sp. MSJ-3 TaxID=2841505 RepID=UPI001C0EA855|nr:MarR family transcriptional regulator [Amphibacillus sp. MSJ-3]